MKVGELSDDDKVSLRKLTDDLGMVYVSDSEDVYAVMDKIGENTTASESESESERSDVDALIENINEDIAEIRRMFELMVETDSDSVMNDLIKDIRNALIDVSNKLEDV
jgi:hypothetical protein